MPDVLDVMHSPGASGIDRYDERIFPPEGAEEAKLLDYRDRLINRWSVYRNSHMARIGLGIWYHLGKQWAELDPHSIFDGVRGVAIREMDDDDDDVRVRPVTNEIDPAIEAELLALVKRRWNFKITPTSNDPSIKAAAKISADVLNSRLETLKVNEERLQHGLTFAVTGTGLIYTWHDRSYIELRPEASPSAVYCPCGTKLYSREVPVDMLRRGVPREGGGFNPTQHLDTAREIPPSPDSFVVDETPIARLQYCPTCPERKPLLPYSENMTDVEMDEGEDVFGRPLGIDVPRGMSALESDLPWEFYPENGGAKVTPRSMREFGRRKIRNLEWIEERYPHLVHLVEPDSVSELLYGDPLLGGSTQLGLYNHFDVGIFDYHANVDELVKLPSFRYPLGRYVVATHNVVLEDGPLLQRALVNDPVEGEQEIYVPRVQMSAARFKIRPCDFWGTGLPDYEISKQNRLNGLDAQIIRNRLLNGEPNWLMPRDQWPTEGMTSEPYGSEGGGRVFFTNPSFQSEGAKPEPFGGQLMSEAVYLERDRIQADIRKSAGPREASVGEPVKNMKAASGLQMMIEQDEQTRALREDALTASWESAASHIQRLEWALRVDPEAYKVLGPDKSWEMEQYYGYSLRGQYEVKIERGMVLGRSIVQREAAREAVADGVVVIDSPLARKRLAENYGLDTDINEDTTHQIDHAERTYVDFKDKGLVRVLDPLDDPVIHYTVLGAHLRTEEMEQRADAIGWDEILIAIAGWEDRYREMVELEAKSIAFYGGKLSGADAGIEYAKAQVQYQEALELFEQYRAGQQQLDAAMAEDPEAAQTAPAPATVQPPVPPPAPVNLPALIQTRVRMVWDTLMLENGRALPTPDPVTGMMPLDPETGEPVPDPNPYIDFRALVTAYLITAGLVAGPVASPGSGSSMAPVDKGGAGAAPSPAAGGAGPGAGPGPAITPKPTVNPTPTGGKN